ncbi:hypothetical protein ACFWB9_33455, partial [Streptomyces sp. NPDC060022]
MALGGVVVGGVRALAASFVVPGPSGVAVRDRLKHLTPQDENVLRAVGEHQGALTSSCTVSGETSKGRGPGAHVCQARIRSAVC